MGQVYLARDKKFDTRKVAVKTVRQDILSSDDLQEGEALTRILGGLVDSIAAQAGAARALAESTPAVIEGKFRAKLEELVQTLQAHHAHK